MTPIVIAFTPNYFVPAATMLQSVLQSSTGSFSVTCLVSEEIPVAMQEKLIRLGAGRLEFRYISLGGCLKDVYTNTRYSEAASYRLLLPELLPKDDKVLYVDCDVIVRQDLSRLYAETAIGVNYLAAVYEAPIEQQAERFTALGCNPRTYFNSGFLLMNLKQMREEHVVEKLLAASKTDWLEFPDQDVLNQVCQGRVLPLSPVYNGIRTFFLPQYKSDFVNEYGDEALWEEVQAAGTIHYTGGKPWDIFSVRFADWWRTFDTLPEEIRSEWNGNPCIRWLWRVYRTTGGRWAMDTLQKVVRKIR